MDGMSSREKLAGCISAFPDLLHSGPSQGRLLAARRCTANIEIEVTLPSFGLLISMSALGRAVRQPLYQEPACTSLTRRQIL